MILEQVAEMNPSIKNKRVTRTLFSCHGLYLRLQAIKLLARLTYPIKITKGQSTLHSNKSHHLLHVDIRHYVGLSGCCGRCGCRWHLKLKHLKLLLKSGDHHYPLLELEVLLLDVVLEVYDRVRAVVQHLTSDV
jgi:hypothetical protein